MENSDKYVVPDNHYFFIGDNRDCSKDSRFLSSVGYVNQINLVGKASLIFFSNDTIVSPLLKFWNINDSVRIERFLKIMSKINSLDFLIKNKIKFKDENLLKNP